MFMWHRLQLVPGILTLTSVRDGCVMPSSALELKSKDL